jgi:ABC-type Fe3+ transport system permease subunit
MSQNWTPPPAGGSEPVPNNLVLAIISIICCFPFGIPAIIFATQVNSKLASGDVAGAKESSQKAKKFAIIGIVAWAICIVLYIILVVVLGVGGALLGGGK